MLYLLLAFIILLLIGVAAYAWLERRESRKKYQALEGDMLAKVSDHAETTGRLQAELGKLARFQHIPGVIERAAKTTDEIAAKVDAAQKKAEAILREAERRGELIQSNAAAKALELTSQANHQLKLAEAQAVALHEAAEARAQESSSRITSEAKGKARKAEEALNRATIYATEIREEAEKKAVQVGGSAYEAIKQAKFYQDVVDAMRNTIKGYGDRYMISGDTILDAWAQEYGFREAGERLKLARDRTRLMEKNRTAATCEYAEAMRRELAINFVMDAFNGKVESILAKVRRDNYGTLKRQVEDSFNLVNFNGKAFRDARISDEYLASRLDELKWAEATQRLMAREREEQRAIREQIRDEERARKEYERAIRQAQRDEDMLKRAIDKVRQEFAEAGVEERGKYEARLQDLAEKLKEAEDKNRRAISMAQQTKCGHVYVISNIGSFGEDVFKIGLTRRLEPMERVKELGDASVPFAFDVHTLIYSDDAPALENALHKKFVQKQVNKANRRKEFFHLGLHEIRLALDEMKVDTKWTMAAEAREYRETLVLENAMRDNPQLLMRWLTDQSKYTPSEEVEEEALEADELAVIV